MASTARSRGWNGAGDGHGGIWTLVPPDMAGTLLQDRHHYAMSAIKDIVDLAKDLESRAKDRRDMDVIHKIQALAFSFQSSYAAVVERDVSLMQKNAELEKQLAEAQAEEIREVT